jgi:hypothetical protein
VFPGGNLAKETPGELARRLSGSLSATKCNGVGGSDACAWQRGEDSGDIRWATVL